MNVMIVDDSRIISKRLEEMLQEIEGVKIVAISEDGIEAYTNYLKQKPDLMILDLMIPKMNGLDVLRSIRLQDNKIVIIILTNYDQSYFRDLSKELGADYFLDKSAEFDKIIQICTNIIKPGSAQDTDYLKLKK